jgi:biopolymer transport protein ExbD/biopolymer transport protein TolR
MDAGGNRAGVRSDINITPLVDVVLVLLIIFMVVTPMLQRGKHVELPKAKHVASKKQDGSTPDPLFVSVTKEGKLYVETDEATPEVLTEKLRTAVSRSQPVLIKADEETEYGKVRPILDRASKAKLKNVGLAATELKGAK